ncbi:MAG: ABC transporter permease [Fibrobacterota bacterium]
MAKSKIIPLVVLVIFTLYAYESNAFDTLLFSHITASLFRLVTGYVLSAGLGILAAIILSLNTYVKLAFEPLISFMRSVPTITWVPLLLIITGISDTTVILAIFLGAFFTIVHTTLDGLENVDKNLLRAARIMGYSRFECVVRVTIPASFPYILVALKMGVAYSWRALVGAEMLGAAQQGLGFLLFTSRQFYNINRAFCTLVIIGMLGYSMNVLIVSLIQKNTVDKWGIGNDRI